MSEWNATWSGSYPCLCCGEWKLYKDGQEVQTVIPFNEDGGRDASTYGTYQCWYFDEDFEENWDEYTDGLNEEGWMEVYKSWLSTVADKSEWPAIYKAFQKSDWRRMSCAGCV